MSTRDSILPDSHWQFNTEVTDAFDDMLRRSIPQYEVMRQSVANLAMPYVKRGTAIVDLGCSRGEALAPFVDRYAAACRFIGVEISPPMLEASRERYRGYINCNIVDIQECDLRTDYPNISASVTLSILTLQFTPLEYRHSILRKVYENTVSGGVFILVEKVLGSTAEINETFIKQYYDLKQANGYSQEQIDRKRLSLEGVLVPLTAKWNEEALAAAGFSHIDCFWRWMNFAGWIAVKSS